VARLLLNRIRLERTRQFGNCFAGLELWKRLGLERLFEGLMDGDDAGIPWSRAAAVLVINGAYEK
jgi:hypothetical protein